MTSPGLGRDAIIALLQELNDELGRRGAKADLFLVGGAALALVYDATRATRDLDAVFLPTDVVRAAAASLADRHALPADWLKDAVKGFLPGPGVMAGSTVYPPRRPTSAKTGTPACCNALMSRSIVRALTS